MNKRVEVEIGDLSPMLMHRHPLEEIEGLGKKTKEEQAEIAAYRVPESEELYVPGTAVWRCLVNGAVYSKGKGRASLQKVAAACFILTPEYIGLGIKNYKIDSRYAVNHNTGNRVLVHRPRIEKWSITFLLDYDDVLLKAAEVRKIVDDSGLRVGLLSFRPANKGPFGRFVVNGWQEIKV